VFAKQGSGAPGSSAMRKRKVPDSNFEDLKKNILASLVSWLDNFEIFDRSSSRFRIENPKRRNRKKPLRCLRLDHSLLAIHALIHS
jgi:hypothetical protein